MENGKKTILFHSNFSKKYTGFGRNAKAVLKYLYSTGKYNIVEYASGMKAHDSCLKNMPWATEGTLPDDKRELELLNRDPNKARMINYGSGRINEMVQKYKPDVYIGAEDIWAFTGYWELPWWNKVNCIIHTTLDSLPLLPLSLQAAPHVKNYYVWASFAEKEMHRQGFNHVKTLHGALECEKFYPKSHLEKKELRKQNGIPENAFVMGFVFRNQLRKSVPNLLDGFKIFLDNNPNSNAYLILHTFYGEGWDIERLVIEKWGSPKKEGESNEDYGKRLSVELKPILSRILTTYYCKQCKKYRVMPFQGKESDGKPRELDCPYCGSKKSLVNINPDNGVSEEQLNEIYNLMDVYLHPFSSGGMEIPVFESKLSCNITLVTDYSCGYEGCCPESYGLPLDWSEYREPGTQFIKASTNPYSIAKQLKKVFDMPIKKREEWGAKAREYTIKNYDISNVGKQWEQIIDSLPEINYDFNFGQPEKNPNYPFQKDIENDADFVKDLYKNILKVEVDESNEGFKNWMKVLSQ